MESKVRNVIVKIPHNDLLMVAIPDLLSVGIFKAWDFGFCRDEKKRECAKVYEYYNNDIFYILPVAYLEAVKNPHSLFYTIIKELPQYRKEKEKDIKAAFVNRFSGGRTESLSGLFETNPTAYNLMLAAMKKECLRNESRANLQRKKLLSLIYQFCKNSGYQIDKAKAIYIAKKACNVENLNDASEQSLIAAIKSFDNQEAEAWVSAVLKKITSNNDK